MTRTGLRRKALLLLLASALAFPWAAYAVLRPGSPRAVEASASVLLGNLLGRAWSFLTGIRNKEGCHLDPSGRCAPGVPVEPQPTIRTDTGCHIDPDGACRP